MHGAAGRMTSKHGATGRMKMSAPFDVQLQVAGLVRAEPGDFLVRVPDLPLRDATGHRWRRDNRCPVVVISVYNAQNAMEANARRSSNERCILVAEIIFCNWLLD